MNKNKLMAVTKTILKRTNLRVYPTKAQELVLSQAFGNSRFIWNYYTSIFLNKDLTTKIYPTVKELKEIYGFDFLKLSPSCCQQQTIRHFQETIKQFFNRRIYFISYFFISEYSCIIIPNKTTITKTLRQNCFLSFSRINSQISSF